MSLSESAGPGYDAAALERWSTEPPKRPGRTAFERDRARVLHSSALRRLAAKTQVEVPWASDFPRTRLTHSLECAQIGRELGKAVGCDPDLVEAACLAHDLGHPPFGHNGEVALDQLAADCGGFEGNAQSLRLLTRLEAKAFRDGPAARSVGLNLTRATLDAATKYPWPKSPEQRKFGVYADDLDAFRWVRMGAPERQRCLEAQIMDWADDVAYSVHDLEDGLHAQHIVLSRLSDRWEQTALAAVAAESYADAANEELIAAFRNLLAQPWWPTAYDGTPRALAALKQLTSQLIGRFCQAAECATHEAYEAGPLARYDADLVVPRKTRLECAMVKAVADLYVMRRRGVAELQVRQRELVTELVTSLVDGAPALLDPAFRPAFVDAADDAARLRVVIDQVASLTDPAATALHGQLATSRRNYVRGGTTT